MKKKDLKEKYLNSVLYYSNLEKKEEKAILILSVLRLLTFFGGIIIIWAGFTLSVFIGLMSAILLTILFLYLLKLFATHSEKKIFLSNLVLINKNEADALSGNFSAFDPGNIYSDIRHDFSYDVDLFGISSLFQYLNRTVTEYGRDILGGWLSDPYSLSEKLVSRQEAIREIAAKDKWRQEFMASGMKTPLKKSEISELIKWLDERALIGSSFLKKMLIILLPAAAIITLLLWIAGIIPYALFVLIFLGNLIYVVSGIKKTNDIHKALSRKYDFLSSMNGLLSTFENESFTSQVLIQIKSNISGKKDSASFSVKKIGRLIQSFDSRNNLMVGFVLNGLLLWDYQCILRLEKWKSEYRMLFPVWLEMVGQVDAYSSLGNYSFNNPEFAYPAISEDNQVFSARDLGHQLIDEDKRVSNNFSLGKGGTICIISGANMAGKSTFLRTIAVNFILGMTGAPVCASELNFKPARIFTSMRTTGLTVSQ